MQPMTRRRFLQLAGMGGAGILFGGCGAAGRAPVLQEAREDAGVASRVNALGLTLPPDALPLEQQIIRLPIGEGSFGHIMESLYNQAYGHAGGYEPLTSLDNDLNVVGVGAERWAVSADGLSWDFALRRELVFSDGAPITAHDWVFTLRRALGRGYDFGWFYGDIKNALAVLNQELPPEQLGITALDDYTLRITTAAPTPYLPALGIWFGVAPRQAYERAGDTWSLNPETYISSGPFTLARFERGVRYEWVLNPSYRGVRRPYVATIQEELQPTGLAAYLTGDVQSYTIDSNAPLGELDTVNTTPWLRAEANPQPATYTEYLGFNTLPGRYPPLDNPDVRLALCKAIDKEALVSRLSRGFAEPAWGILPRGFPNAHGDALKELEPNRFDPEAARQLLARAGYPDGAGFPTFALWVRQPDPASSALAEAIQARWKEHLGITVELRTADVQSFTDVAFAQQRAPLYYVAYALDYYDPSTFLNVFRDGGRHPHRDPDWTAFYNQANATLDAGERLRLLAEAERRLVEGAAWYFLRSPFALKLWPCNLAGEAVQPNKEGFRFNVGNAPGAPQTFQGLYWSDAACRPESR